MKTRTEMIYEVIVALASNPAMIQASQSEDFVGYKGEACDITCAAAYIVDDYLEYLEGK